MTTFADLGLSPETLSAVEATGYTTPTPIQEQAIPVALAGRDVLGIAQTGTGKTAAFTLPLIDKLAAGRAKARMPRSLVIEPTRELADQVAASFEKYAQGRKLSWALLIGGVSFADQLAKLDRGVDVLIATPGRLLDLYDRRKLLMMDVKTLVVDEADRMLDMGFIPDLERIFQITPAIKQTLFFSATMPPEITRLTTQFLKDPTRIEASRPATTGENIKQFVLNIPMSDPKAKRLALRTLVERASAESGIVFCNRKTDVDIVAKSLAKHGFDARPIHGDLDQSMRTKTLDAFRKGELKLLVASDVAARGLDIPAVSHVFNYDVPHHAEDYVHRIGRTGRAGREGETLMIVTPADSRGYDKVLKLTKKTPENLVLEIDWSQAEGGDEPRRARSSTGRTRSEGAPAPARSRARREGPVLTKEPVTAALPPIEPAFEGVEPEVAQKPARRARTRRKPDVAPAEAELAVSAHSDAPGAEASQLDGSFEPAPAPPASAAPMRQYGRSEAEPMRSSRPSAYGRGGIHAQEPREEGRFGSRERAVVGFGDEVPDFLARATPLPPAARKAPAMADD